MYKFYYIYIHVFFIIVFEYKCVTCKLFDSLYLNLDIDLNINIFILIYYYPTAPESSKQKPRN